MPDIEIQVRKRSRPERNAFRERVEVVWYEVKCPTCARWTGLADRVLAGLGPFICPTLGCSFRLTLDFRPWAAAADRARDEDRAAQR